MEVTRTKKAILALCAAGLLFGACNSDEVPGSGVVSGTVSYFGSPAGIHALFVSVKTDVGATVAVAYRTYYLEEALLLIGYDYSVPDVPPGSYYVEAYWDTNDSFLKEGADPEGWYGSKFVPELVEVSEGEETTAIDILLVD